MNDKLPEIDIHQLERNLKLSPEERILRHQKALDLVLELKKSKVITNEKSQPPRLTAFLTLILL